MEDQLIVGRTPLYPYLMVIAHMPRLVGIQRSRKKNKVASHKPNQASLGPSARRVKERAEGEVAIVGIVCKAKEPSVKVDGKWKKLESEGSATRLIRMLSEDEESNVEQSSSPGSVIEVDCVVNDPRSKEGQRLRNTRECPDKEDHVCGKVEDMESSEATGAAQEEKSRGDVPLGDAGAPLAMDAVESVEATSAVPEGKSRGHEPLGDVGAALAMDAVESVEATGAVPEGKSSGDEPLGDAGTALAMDAVESVKATGAAPEGMSRGDEPLGDAGAGIAMDAVESVEATGAAPEEKSRSDAAPAMNTAESLEINGFAFLVDGDETSEVKEALPLAATVEIEIVVEVSASRKTSLSQVEPKKMKNINPTPVPKDNVEADGQRKLEGKNYVRH